MCRTGRSSVTTGEAVVAKQYEFIRSNDDHKLGGKNSPNKTLETETIIEENLRIKKKK